ncbi:MAG: LLM class flavin-dependent oxidoreductase [Chloroflexi bacterium]|nr:LLM class flavin-dependent oxidoreductase [Chloroflexota bacterium]
MRFGLWYDFRNPSQWAQPFPQLYREVMDQVQLAEELGYDSIWLSEHHFAEDGYCPSLMPMAAAVAAVTKRVRIGTSVLLLPLHHPIRIAEDGAVVDILSNGRFVLGVGLGYRPKEYAGFGLRMTQRPSRMEESIEVIRRAWTMDQFSFSGKHFQIGDVSVIPKPVQRPHPPILIGGTKQEAIRRAARLGSGLVLGGRGGRTQYQLYAQALAEYGHDIREMEVAIAPVVYVAEDDRQAWEDVKEHLFYQYRMYRAWNVEGGHGAEYGPALANADELPRQNYLIGSPESCRRGLERILEAMPATEVFFWAMLPGVDPAKARASFTLFAREVMPHFKG